MTNTNITLTRGKTKISLDLDDNQLKSLLDVVQTNEGQADLTRTLKYLVDSLPPVVPNADTDDHKQ